MSADRDQVLVSVSATLTWMTETLLTDVICGKKEAWNALLLGANWRPRPDLSPAGPGFE